MQHPGVMRNIGTVARGSVRGTVQYRSHRIRICVRQRRQQDAEYYKRQHILRLPSPRSTGLTLERHDATSAHQARQAVPLGEALLGCFDPLEGCVSGRVTLVSSRNVPSLGTYSTASSTHSNELGRNGGEAGWFPDITIQSETC